MSRRARDLGIRIGALPPGPLNAITDVAGVAVGHTTLIEGEGELFVGEGPVRTGVTVVVPRAEPLWESPLFCGYHRLNGNGEVTGLQWIADSGLLTSPIALTNTHSLGVVRDALIAAEALRRPPGDNYWRLPVVAETWDGVLNDINGFHVQPENVEQALAAATGGEVAEGSVGGGTGMICHGFKGGIGTASRRVPVGSSDEWIVGVLVQANHGRRARLTVNGAPVGAAINAEIVPEPETRSTATAGGSIIVVVATDAPLLAPQCARLASRAGLGIGRTGGVGEHYSGDLFLGFATGNTRLPAGDYEDEPPLTSALAMVNHGYVDPLFDAVVDATEEAIVNALLAAETMEGRDRIVAHGLDGGRLVEVLDRYSALARPGGG